MTEEHFTPEPASFYLLEKENRYNGRSILGLFDKKSLAEEFLNREIVLHSREHAFFLTELKSSNTVGDNCFIPHERMTFIGTRKIDNPWD
jgi:hypothetical protein